MSAKKIFEEVWSYYDFHQEIYKYFNEGINFNPSEQKIKLYFIDNNWIRSWKNYSRYEDVIKMERDYKFLEENGFLNYNEKHYLGDFKTGKSYSNFLYITVHKREDFDCIVDEKTYNLFKRYKKNTPIFDLIFNRVKIKNIYCFFYEKFLVLITEKRTRIILYSKFIKEPNSELIQLSLNLPEYKYNKQAHDFIEGIIDIFTNKEEPDYCFVFESTYLDSETKRENLIKELTTNLRMDVNQVNKIKLWKKEFNIMNNNLNQKDITYVDNSDKLILLLNNSQSPRLIGLENFEETCYMNETLQCLVNIKEFTKYLLTKDNFSYIIKNIEKCELLSSYCQLLVKLCCDEDVVNYYAPKKFKNILSLKNPLFEGIQANDSKDLIYFLLEHMNFELNTINLKINQNLQKMNSDTIINEMNQSDKIFMISSFISEYSSENNNIIPKLFYSLIENESVCNGCKIHKYNYQITFSLEMPLETIYKKIYGNQNINQGKKTLNLIQCIQNYNETNYFTGENAMYCNKCQRQENSIYNKRMHSLSPILIIILNRGKANQFNCDVDFPERISFQEYVLNPKINFSYRLIGVVTHFGTSDMGGHFIAYCRHRILNEWYCYNDAVVTKLTDQQNGYKKGVPYILFYESEQGNNNILFDNSNNNTNNNNIIHNIQNIPVQNFGQNFVNNSFSFNIGNNINNMNFQNNLNMPNNNINNMNFINMNNNGFNNNFQNMNHNFINNINNNMNCNMNNNLNKMPNNMNYNMNNNNININNNNMNMNNNIPNNNNFSNNLNNNMNFNMNNMNQNFNFNISNPINNMNNNQQMNDLKIITIMIKKINKIK